MTYNEWTDFAMYVHNDEIYMYGQPVAKLTIPEGSNKEIFKELLTGACYKNDAKEVVQEHIEANERYVQDAAIDYIENINDLVEDIREHTGTVGERLINKIKEKFSL